MPVVPRSTARVLEAEADELIALEIPPDDEFLGSVGAYYGNFPQIEDREVITLLKTHKKWLAEKKTPQSFSIKA